MQEIIQVNVGGLLSQSLDLQYRKRFGTGFAGFGSIDEHSFSIRVIKDESARFVNLFGLSIDAKTGNIALGLFPNSDEYICIGNFFEDFINRVSLNVGEYIDKSTLRDLLRDDIGYILEQMKLNPAWFLQGFSTYLSEKYLYQLKAEDKKDYSKSVTLNISNDNLKYRDFLSRKLIPASRLIDMQDMIYGYLSLSREIELVAHDYFCTFISEKSFDEVCFGLKFSLKDLMTNSISNLEALTIKYLNEGIPFVLLRELKSYGLGIKQRKEIFEKCKSMVADKTRFYEVLRLGELASSFYYLLSRDTVVDIHIQGIRSFNIIDLVRARGWLDSLLFSLDVLFDHHNVSAYNSLASKFSFQEILKELAIQETEFIMNLREYQTKVTDLIDGGSVYTRKVLGSQNILAAFNSVQLDKLGEIFSSSSNLILSKFDLGQGDNVNNN